MGTNKFYINLKTKKKYHRIIFYDKIQKKWVSYYTNKTGKIIIDKKTNKYSDLRKKYNKDDFTKIKKAESFGYRTIINEKKIQDKLDRLIRKKKLTDIDKQILNKYFYDYSYRNNDIKQKLKLKETYNRDKELLYFFNVVVCKKTSPFFLSLKKEFKLFKELFSIRKLDSYKSFEIEITIDDIVITGYTRKKNFWLSQKKFTAVMVDIIGEGFSYKQIEWIKTRAKIKFRGLT